MVVPLPVPFLLTVLASFTEKLEKLGCVDKAAKEVAKASRRTC
jgi:hypothetical protein